MVKEDAVARIHMVTFSVVDGDPIGVEFCHSIGGSRIEWRCFLLRGFLDESEELTAGCLIEFGFDSRFFDGIKNTKCTKSDNISRVFGYVKTYPYVTLGAEVIDFIGFNFFDEATDATAVGEVSVMEEKFDTMDMRVLVEVIDAPGIKGAGSSDDAMDFVALFQEEFREIGSVLSGNAGNECLFH